MPSSVRRRFILSILIVAVSTPLAACNRYKPQGPWSSGDSPLTWQSTAHEPKTISLIDTRTGETLWSVDVPVGRQLVVEFKKGASDDEYMPDVMHWQIMAVGKRNGRLNSSISAPPSTSRRIDFTIRSSPELSHEALTQTPASMDIEHR